MDDIAVDCAWADTQIEQDENLALHLPSELRLQILQTTGSQYLDAVALAARLSPCTDRLFVLYRPLFIDISARWLRDSASGLGEEILTFSALARVLPFVRLLKSHAIEVLERDALRQFLAKPCSTDGSVVNDHDLLTLLTGVFRLLSFERHAFDRLFNPIFFTSLLRHESPPVRYLAVECLCLVMHFADAFCENLHEVYVGKQPVLGLWEGVNIDYRLLKLWEERRWKQLETEHGQYDVRRHTERSTSSKMVTEQDLQRRTALVGGVLLPRVSALESSTSQLVLTNTSTHNLHHLGIALQEQKSILLAGPAGSGKTALIMEAARQLNKVESMVTLHLNEQTDAKSLIGLYTSSTTGGSFVWQPGVLTRALQQGRWVLIEDIDRAPAEVLGVLRPVIENGSLFIANRRQHVKAADGFRLVATIRTASESPTSITARHSWLTNKRLWSVVTSQPYASEEINELLCHRFPALAPMSEVILNVHNHLSNLYTHDTAFRSAQGRLPALRDLLKWCRRINHRGSILDLRLANSPVPESFNIDIFKDAINCYASHLSDPFLYNKVAESVARSVNIAPQQKDFYLSPSEDAVAESSSAVKIGRSSLPKLSSRRAQGRIRPFASTLASRIGLENVAAGVDFSEPCLLMGETGVGKTSLVQHIASMVGQILTVVNLSQQSEVSDLLGGLKPVTTRSIVLPVVEQFNVLFDDTFSASRNEKFQSAVNKAVTKQNWVRLLKLWQEALQMADKALNKAPKPVSELSGTVPVTKRRKIETPKYESLRQRWLDFQNNVRQLQSQVERGDKTHTFSFVEGRLVQAVRNGEWLLLDEINLASSDTLDHIVSLLAEVDGQRPSILLTEAGNVEKVIAHPSFRVFAAMNPATDAGKKDLPPALRSRFTELYVQSGDDNVDDLVKVIQSYLGDVLSSDRRAALDLARTYLEVQQMNLQHRLTDGAGDAPHFSIRSLVRCLLYVMQHSRSHGLRRSMYEGFAMSFFTALSRESENLTLPIVEKHLLSSVKNVKSFLAQQPKLSHHEGEFVAFRHHLISKGQLSPDLQPHYIRTASVERNLMNLARAASMRRFPILLQGPTSAGKTSMVEYLAKLSGNKFVRINNHEHTDLQEYLGSYGSDSDGKLRFREGVLVDALRQGHWIVLDELNLAPSDVLEALNRLLDDNRELLIPETQEVVRPHPNFMLFATQNPAGLYGGRKRLSRAFRNRFLEIHFDDIPEDELEVILRERAQIAPSFCTQIVSVYKKLSLQRQSSRLFEQRNSFATLRDLFRWASRPVDDRQQLAQHGFMLLAERVREVSEREIVKTTIEETMKVKIDESVLYGVGSLPNNVHDTESIVWTAAMRRLYVLVSSALQNKEPVLLVGETGCGKTQICQVVAAAFGRSLNTYNAHTNTETGDLIGSQRPIRSRTQLAESVVEHVRPLLAPVLDGLTNETTDVDDLIARFEEVDAANIDAELLNKARLSIGAYQSLFAWSDGSLVRSMKLGEHFLLDEISLADDSVLERLNSVLEPARTIVLAEKGSVDNVVVARPEFQFLSTMNPGGDYGKRELSAALRNRMTEIWVPPLSQDDDVLPIVRATLNAAAQHLAPLMLKFTVWFKSTLQSSITTTIPLRDLLTWAKFVNASAHLPPEVAFVHGAGLVFVDSIGANPAGMTASTTTDVAGARQKCLNFLQTLVSIDVDKVYNAIPELSADEASVKVGLFGLQRVPDAPVSSPDLVFDAPTTLKNTMRIVRALQLDRPVLLEGNPGVGKTAIVTALARAAGKPFTRINLSDQTDLMDLFGADAPSENESLGRFSWKDGPLLQAMQTGGWVLLDEMNLASQSVLEGLNSCLDHRKEAYIAELDKSFSCHPGFKLFAAQNPHHQGGGRKGLPASFVNRFTVVYADPFLEEDLMRICQTKYPTVKQEQLTTIVRTIAAADDMMQHQAAFSQGGPWEVNLRDVSRWLALCQEQPQLNPMYHFDMIIQNRFRGTGQSAALQSLYDQNRGNTPFVSHYSRLTKQALQIGIAQLSRRTVQQHVASHLPIPAVRLQQAMSLATAITNGWPVIVAGPADSGKTELIRSLAASSGSKLVEISMNADIDTMDLLGGFEQYDPVKDLQKVKIDASEFLMRHLQQALVEGRLSTHLVKIMAAWQACQSSYVTASTLLSALQDTERPVDQLPWLQKLVTLAKQETNSHSQFVWNDGVLIDAVQNGSWVVLDNANLCNASVLDRLNSLLESDGHLVISEQHSGDGAVRVIRPHRDFRIFLTVDPKYGELSRAMRNRSFEVFLPPLEEPFASTRVPTYPFSASASRLRDLAALSNPQYRDVIIDNLAAQDAELVLSSVRSGASASPFLELDECSQMQLEQARSATGSISSVLEATQLPASGPLLQRADAPLLPLLDEPQFAVAVQQGTDQVFRSVLSIWHLRKLVTQISVLVNASLQRASTLGVVDLSVLDRSALATRSKKGAATSVPAVYAFAKAMLTFLEQQTSAMAEANTKVATGIAHFVLDLMAFMSRKNIDPARLQAYLQIGQELGSSASDGSVKPIEVFRKSLELFSLVRLRYGQGLQAMWADWSPRVPQTMKQLQVKLRLEDLLLRFDEATGTMTQSRSELGPMKLRLLDAANTAWLADDGGDVVNALKSSVRDLEGNSDKVKTVQVYFGDIFEEMLYKLQPRNQGGLSVAAEALVPYVNGRTTISLALGSNSSLPAALSALSQSAGLVDTEGKLLTASLINKMSDMQSQPLHMLGLLTEELEQLTKTTSSAPALLTRNTIYDIRQHVTTLLMALLHSNRQLLTETAVQVLSTKGAAGLPELSDMDTAAVINGDGWFAQLHTSYLQSGLACLQHVSNKPDTRSLSHLGQALVAITAAALAAVVPDKPYDPALQPQLVAERHALRQAELMRRLLSQKTFNLHVAGQESSLVSRLLAADLEDLGSTPAFATVARPDVSSLGAVQDEFLLIIRSVLESPALQNLVQYGITHDEKSAGEANRLKDTIARVIDRLQRLDRAYDDIVVPVKQLLQSLNRGIELLVKGQGEEVATPAVVKHTPLLGASPLDVNHWPLQGLRKNDQERLQWLRHYTLMSTLDRSNNVYPSATALDAYTTVIDSFYVQWKERLGKDQADAEAKSRYYAYRGGDDEEEDVDQHEISEMFPVFDDAEVHEEPDHAPDELKRFDARAVASQLAQIHEQVFGSRTEPVSLPGHISNVFENIGSSSRLALKTALPVLLLQMQSKMTALQDGDQTKSFNIYTDANIEEIRKLHKLIQSIQSRFWDINEKWPEHAVPIEVLAVCDELLAFRLDSPLAKLLTKTEKLLDIVAQWQSVASREWSVAGLVEDVTALLISWRRLELSSWSRLLDLEKQKHDESAASWFFIAYEAVVYNSRAVVETGGDLSAYCFELAKTMEEFLRSTSTRQFVPRLELLQSLGQLLSGLAQNDERLLLVVGCVSNVVGHYQRYVDNIQKSLQTGRADLEKAVVEQIKLASWKDTNPTALKDSARRSHYKLFKIVKKYRALLNKPIAAFKADELHDGADEHKNNLQEPQHVDLQQVLATCSNAVSDWQSRPERLRNPLVAAVGMRRVYSAQDGGLDISDELSTFRTGLIKSIKDLRKETPSTLTKDNTTLVKHLRERKRRLLADTIKDVSHMGVRRNLPSADLEKQASSAIVLASMPRLANSVSTVLVQADLSMHELLDSMPQARMALAEHSADLTDGEVRRGVGLLEGLLLQSLKQREELIRAASNVQDLADAVHKVKNLSATPDQINVVSGSQLVSGDLGSRLRWLPAILGTAVTVLEIQIKQSGLDLEELVTNLRSTAQALRELGSEITSSPQCSTGLRSAQEVELTDKCWLMLQDLGDRIRHWQRSEPNIEYLTSQLLPWTERDESTDQKQRQVNGINYLALSSIDQALRDITDSIFVALQQLSAVKTKPVSDIEDSGWLLQNDKHFSETLRALHISSITSKLAGTLDNLRYVQTENLAVALSLLVLAGPIIEQFSFIAQHAVDRQASVHCETTKLACFLAKSFTTVATEGFCTPSEPNDGKEESGQLESGTGLGDGEGAEDISKDVGAEEDLSEFAQGEQEDKDGEMEDAEGAVDMGADDLEGQTGDAGEREQGSGDESGSDAEGEEMDEEAGSIDDLDPTAVDEKMWDEAQKEGEKDEKELKGERKEGEKTREQTEAGGEKEEGDADEGEGAEVEEIKDDDEAGEGKAEAEHADPHLQDEKALELPEELQLNGEEEKGEDGDADDDGMSQLSDVEMPDDGGTKEDAESVSDAEREEQRQMDDEVGEPEGEDEEAEGKAQGDEIVEDQNAENEEKDREEREGEMQFDQDEQAGGEKGAADQVQADIDPAQDAEGQNKVEQAQDEKQPQGSSTAENQDQGESGKGTVERGQGREDQRQRQQKESLRKLADVLEQWHQRREIFDPAEDKQDTNAEQDVDMKEADFEHLDGGEDDSDAQALGPAGPDETQNLDMSKGIQDDHTAIDEDTAMPDPQDLDAEEEQDLASERLNRLQAETSTITDRRNDGAFVPDRQTQHDRLDRDQQDLDTKSIISDTASDIHHLALQTHPSTPPTSTLTATQLWHHCATLTHTPALHLTEQLRLILHPTTATKLRGDFRTGKRLNLKRIIPYIASGYKRDKIWMRRSVPSKRHYQILLAIDDSKSMAESGADLLALQTTSLLCTSLAMLEVGEVGVVGFGEDSAVGGGGSEEGVKVAFPFGKVWQGAESGLGVFEKLGFRQKGTDVRLLMERGLGMLRDARLNKVGGGGGGGATSGEELWQLMVIVSDGHCGRHEEVRRLVREGKAERVMVVFVVVDNVGGGDGEEGEDGDGTGKGRKGESILDLKEATFEEVDGEMKVVTRRYLERFPFEYYLVVRDVRELPGVLGRCLRGWFAEVGGT